ncbi:MAG: sodium/proline symporter [Treponema sp.]|jgi:sodium/proline symporter|nr:sodium/proline symporter [Treponema sp.]
MTATIFQTLIGIVAYLLIMIAIGLWYARRSNSNMDEYFLGNRGLGPWVAAMSTEASDMSGWLLMGLPGVAYFTGSGEAFWTALGLAIGTWLNWHIVAKRLRIYSQVADNSITLPEFFSKRFHDKKHILMTIAAITILVFFSIYVGSQFVTFGKFFAFVFNAENYYTAMVIFGAIVVLIYTLVGGFMAVCMTDLIQGILMFCALVVVLVCGFIFSGGFSGVSERLSDFPRFLDIFGIATPSLQDTKQVLIDGVPQFGAGANYSLLNIVSCMAWGLGYFGMPQVLIRFMAITKASKIRQSKYIAVIWCLISLFAAVAIGLVGRAYMPSVFSDASAAENIFISMTLDFFPPLLAGVVLSGVLAASMSSSDSYMITVSSSLANDLFKPAFKKASEGALMWVARIAIIMVTIFGVMVALSGDNSIFRIVSYAWAGLGAAFGPLVLFSLFWKRTTLPAAVAGMLSGGIIVVVWKNFISGLGGAFAVYELLPAFLISALVIFVVSLCTKVSDPTIEKEFDIAVKGELD